MKVQFHALTGFAHPALHIWRPGAQLVQTRPPEGQGQDGWYTFESDLDYQIHAPVYFKLLDRGDGPAESVWELDAHNRLLPRIEGDRFPRDVWFMEGISRVLTADPLKAAADEAQLHVITQRKYRGGKLFVWTPTGESTELTGTEEDTGMRFRVPLSGVRRHLFAFKLIQPNGRYEDEYANRLWSAADGAVLWTHSDAAEVSSERPVRKQVRVRFRQELEDAQVVMHVWQQRSDFVMDVCGVRGADGWSTHTVGLYSGLAYGIKFWNLNVPEVLKWEHAEAERNLVLPPATAGFTDVWTLEGDCRLFDQEPRPDHRMDLEISIAPPGLELKTPYHARVWVNHARWPLHARVKAAQDGRLSFDTFSGVITSFICGDEQSEEPIRRHTLVVKPADPSPSLRYVVLGRADVLIEPPPRDLFQDPPFLIRRPGAYEQDGHLRFVLHAPSAARAQVIGDWTGWNRSPLEMRSTRDGAYWWATVPVAAVADSLPASYGRDYHGALYKYRLSGLRDLQDPAAGWVEGSSPEYASRLIRSDRFEWHDAGRRFDDWSHWIVYQLHPARFSTRYPDLAPLLQVAREIEDQAGYLHQLKVTTILLMPVNEVASHNSWGYDPAFYYAVEDDYGGPDALKALVDTCHRHGLSVMLDVVFNHAGNQDNILWAAARESYFDGDTAWGPLINFDHPQVRHFFEQNLVYLQREYHVDGFRLDHTDTILHQNWFVRVPGSGGGWAFLQGLRHALATQGDRTCLLMAEQLPNDWGLTNYGGPMDTQWSDAFHDRLEDAARGRQVMGRLADAMSLSQTAADNWYKVTNYPESHDEVGNVPDRIVNVAGWGRGFRMSKVAGAATLLTRGLPMFFMGAESGEVKQFKLGDDEALDIEQYLRRPDMSHVRAWWNRLSELHENNAIKGPSPLHVQFAHDQRLAFSRGDGDDYFVVLNFGGWEGGAPLAELNLPDRTYKELWNSSWPDFAVEGEDEYSNGGRDARLARSDWLNIPDYGVVVLERV